MRLKADFSLEPEIVLKGFLLSIGISGIILILSWYLNNRIYFDMISRCKLSPSECECAATYMNDNLTMKEYRIVQNIVTNNNEASYIFRGILSGDKIAKVMVDTINICKRNDKL